MFSFVKNSERRKFWQRKLCLADTDFDFFNHHTPPKPGRGKIKEKVKTRQTFTDIRVHHNYNSQADQKRVPRKGGGCKRQRHKHLLRILTYSPHTNLVFPLSIFLLISLLMHPLGCCSGHYHGMCKHLYVYRQRRRQRCGLQAHFKSNKSWGNYQQPRFLRSRDSSGPGGGMDPTSDQDTMRSFVDDSRVKSI